MSRTAVWMVAIAVLCTSLAMAADDTKVVPATDLKFANVPGIPSCAKIAVENGAPDSDKGSVLLLKATAGCVVPWHWHTPDEQLGIVSGTFRIEMKDGGTKSLTAGSYVNMEGKHPHQATCTTACTVFLASNGKFDIHYIDASGNEISPDEALKTKGAAKPAASKGAAKKQ